MKTLHFAAAALLVVTLTACNNTDDRATADQVADTNMTSVNRVQGTAPDASVDVRVNTGEIKEDLRDAAGATRNALERAGEKIRIETRDFADAVSRKLSADPQVGAASKNVEIRANEGRVTLTGTVRSEAEKAELERKIREITDATQVDNQLRVSAQ